ncbi:MAG: hypothetical protein E7390_07160 [Ruminococcaceae bacterium]|nr:hypothetical protein [Oscillospiraceae bacterium]
MQESRYKGLSEISDGQALALGVIAGASEAITEKIGMDELMNVKGAKSWKQYIVRNARAEAGEEGISNVANFLGDIIVAGDESEFQKNIEYYVKEKGLKENEAFGRAVGDQLLSIGLDSLSGFITGGVLSGATAIFGSAAQGMENRAEENEMVRGMQEWLAERKSDTGASYRIGRTIENKPFVEVEEDVLNGIPEKEWTKTVKQNLKKKFPEGIIAGNNTINIDNKSRKEMTYSGYMKWLYNNEPGIFADKLRATNNADEIVLAATNWVNEAKGHERNDNIESFARGNTLIKIGGRDYLADVVVATRNNGNMLLYDILNLSPTSITEKETGVPTAVNPSPEAHRNNTSISNKSISQTTSLSQENNNKSFAISRTLPRAGESGPVLPTAKEEMEERMRQRRAAEAKTETERTGILYGATEENIGMAVRISEAINREVVFYENTDPNVKNDDGYYNSRDGKIYINAKSENAIPRIIAHEMTHSVELADSYIDLFRTVIRRIQKTGGSIQEMRNEIKTRYENNGVKLSHNAQIDVEIMAEYIAENLLTDEASIASLAKESPKSARGILHFLDFILAKLGNTNAQERVFVAKARALYAKALGETQSTAETESERMRGERPVGADSIRPDENGAGNGRIVSAPTVSETTGEKHPIIRENVLPTAAERFGNKTAEAQMHENDNPSTTDAVPLPLHKRGETREVQTGKEAAVQTESDISEDTDTAWDADLYDGLTEEEYDEKMDTLDAEASMAGESMLYEDGRQYSIKKEKGVANEEKTNYNNINNKIGGTENGRKMDNGRDRRVQTKTAGKQTGEGTHGSGEFQEGIYREGDTEGRSRSNVRYKDSEGRRISPENAEKLRGTAIVDKMGRPMAVYHFTPETDFKTFAKGDIGFHFGTQAQANKRRSDLAANSGRMFRAYLNIQNPVHLNADIMNWRANAAALRLWSDGVITEEERQEIESLWVQGKEYDSPAAVRLREILAEKRYDGIVYPNGFEGDGDSFIAFRDEQIIEKEIEDVNPDVDRKQYAIAKDTGEETENAESTIFNGLPRKAQAELTRTERYLSERIGEILGVPKQAQRAFLKSMIRQISEGYMENGKVDREKADALFEEAYSQGVVVNADYFERYKHIKDHLRNTQLTISEEDRSSIADFGAFRKSAFGKLRIVNEGGLPVDVAYAELEEMAPELFPEDITHPADQLQHMFEVADGIRISEQTLDEAYGEDAETFREAARDEFHTEINSAAVDFKRVKRYSEDRSRIAEERAAEESESIKSREDLDEAYKNLKTARRNMEKVKRRVLLTEQDEMRVGQLLRGEINPMMLDTEADNVKDILAVYRAKKEYEAYARRIREWNERRKKGLRAQAQEYLVNIRKWKDKTKFGGLRYSLETMERNFRDVMGEDAEALITEYITPVHKAQAEDNVSNVKNFCRKRKNKRDHLRITCILCIEAHI